MYFQETAAYITI